MLMMIIWEPVSEYQSLSSSLSLIWSGHHLMMIQIKSQEWIDWTIRQTNPELWWFFYTDKTWWNYFIVFFSFQIFSTHNDYCRSHFLFVSIIHRHEQIFGFLMIFIYYKNRILFCFSLFLIDNNFKLESEKREGQKSE